MHRFTSRHWTNPAHGFYQALRLWCGHRPYGPQSPEYYDVTEMLIALGLSSFDTVIHNYRKSFLYVWSKHSNDLVKLLRCMSPSAFSWLILCFIVLFFTYSVCLYRYVFVCLAMLPDSNKMMMMMMMMMIRLRRYGRLYMSRGGTWCGGNLSEVVDRVYFRRDAAMYAEELLVH